MPWVKALPPTGLVGSGNTQLSPKNHPCAAMEDAARTNCTSFAQALPFDLISIQVDGGSEFRDEFEQACEVLKNPLFVLPPRKPNGMVVWNGPM